MRKKVLLTIAGAFICAGVYAQSVGDYIRTTTGKYKITGSNIITNGDFSDGLTGWSSGSGNALSTDSFTVVDNGGPVNNGAYIKALYSTAEALGGAIHNAWATTSNKLYVMSYYTKSETSASVTNGYEYCYQNMDGSTDKTSSTGYDNTGMGNSVSYGTSWKQIAYAFTSTGGYAAVHFYYLAAGTDFANFFVGEATEVANTDSLLGEITIAQAYYDDARYVAGKEELQSSIEAAKATYDEENTEANEGDIATVLTAIQTLQSAVSDYVKANTVDISSKITNASFGALTGWTTNKGGWKMNTKATYSSASGNTVNYFCEAWLSAGSTLTSGEIYQTLSDMPAGQYQLSADVLACQQKDASLTVTGMKLFANDDSVSCSTGNGVFQGYSVDFALSELGNIKLGMRLNSTNGNWIAFDNVKLVFIGDTAAFNKQISNIAITKAQNALQVMIDSAKTVYAMDKYVLGKQVLQDSIDLESTFLTSEDVTILGTAMSNMRSAINNYYAENEVLFALQDEIAKAQALYDDATYKSGKEDLSAAITTAQGFLTSTDVTAIAQADTTLMKAETQYGIVNASYAHPINLCTNGTMSSMDGWTVLNGGTANPALHINSTGSAGSNVAAPFMECWVASTSTFGAANYAYQELSDMPAGLYIFKAAVNACNQGYTDPSAITGVSVFLNVGDVEHSVACATGNGTSQYYTIETELTEVSNLKYGLNIDATTTANWIAWDNVSLQFVGDATAYRKDSAQALLTQYIDSLKSEIAVAQNLLTTSTNPQDVDTGDFETAIDDANNILDAGTTGTEFEDAITALKAAEITFMKSGVYPPEGGYFDMTDVITNASCDAVDGWTSDNTAVTACPGEGTWYKALNENFHQTVEGLPVGEYILEVKAFHRNAWYVTTAYYDTAQVMSKIYVNNDSVSTKGIAYDATIVPLLEELSTQYSFSKFDLTHCGTCIDTLYNRGYYKNYVKFAITEEDGGEATLGIMVNEGAANGNFTGWRDFVLRFYGTVSTGMDETTANGNKTSVINNNVYNSVGTLVRSNAQNLNGLQKGLYIMNGKKYVVE